MLPSFYEIDNRTSIAEFSNNLIVTVPFKDLIKFDDVRMVQFFKQLQLCKHFIHLRIVHTLLFDALHSSHFFRLMTNRLEDASVRTFPNFLLYSVMLPDIFFSKKNEFFLIYFYSSIIIIHYILGYNELL